MLVRPRSSPGLENPMTRTPRPAAPGLALVVVASVLAALPSGPASAAAGRPDLVTSSVSAPASAVRGQTVRLRDVTVNKGPARAAKSVTTYYLSTDKRLTRGDRALGGRSVPALAPRSRRAGSVTVRVPAATVVRSFWVLACADARKRVRESREGNNCSVASRRLRVLAPTPPPPPPAPGGDGPSAAMLAELTEAAGPLYLFRAPTATGRTVSSTVDETGSVTRTIGPAGGSLTTTDPRGHTATLTVPANALVAPVEITATPVASTDGEGAVDGTAVGMRLEPEGLTFLEPAILSVTPAHGDLGRSAVGMVSASDGALTRPEAVLPEPGRLAMPVHHFSMVRMLVSNGDGGWSTQFFSGAEYTATVGAQVARLLEQLRDAVDDAERAELVDRLNDTFDQHFTNLVAPLLGPSTTDCGFFRDNFETALSHLRTRELLSLPNEAHTAAVYDALRRGLQNCWVEVTRECLTMAPARFGEVVTLARTMAIMGVRTASGEEPDPFALPWCGDVTGVITMTETDTHVIPGRLDSTEIIRSRLWVTATTNGVLWWENPDLYHLSFWDAGTVVDVNGAYHSVQTSERSGGVPCTITQTAGGKIVGERANLTLGQATVSATTNVATHTDGLAVQGSGAGIPRLSVPLTEVDGCRDGESLPWEWGFAWSVPLLSQPYRLTVDPDKGNLHTSWRGAEEDCDGCRTEWTVDVELHVDGLTEFLAAGPPARRAQ